MSERLSFDSLTIHEMPGFAPGQFPPISKLGRGLNLVWGPNGSGKTTMASAMRSMLWRGCEVRKPCNVSAEVSIGASSYTYSRRDAELKQENRATGATGSGDLPGEAVRDRYWLPLHELLEPHGKDPFLEAIQKEIHGGINLAEVTAKAGGAASFSTAGLKARKEYADARDALKVIEAGHAGAANLPAEIRQLDEDIAGIQTDKSELERLNAAIAHLERQKKLAVLEDEKRKYSPDMSLFEENDPTVLAGLQEALQARNERLHALKAEAETAQQAMAGCRVPEELALRKDIFEYVRSLRDDLQAAQTQMKVQTENLARSRAAEQKWQADHQWWLPQKPEESVVRSVLEQIQAVSARTEAVRCRLASAQNLCKALGTEESPDGPPSSAYGDLLLRLRDWIEADAMANSEQRGLTPARSGKLLLVIAAIAVLTVILSLAVHGACSLVGLAIPVVVYMWTMNSAREGQSALARRSLAREQIEQLGLGTPASWDLIGVSSFTSLMAKKQGATAALEDINRQRKLASAELDAAREAQAGLYAELGTAVKALRLQAWKPQLDDAVLYHYVTGLMEWYKLRSEVERNEASRKLAEQSRQETVEKASAMLAQVKIPLPDKDALGVAAALNTLESSVQSYQQEYVKYQRILKEAGSTRDEADKLTTDIGNFWAKRNLGHGAIESLRDLCSKVPTYKELLRDINTARREISSTDTTAFKNLIEPDRGLQALSDLRTIVATRLEREKDLYAARAEKRTQLAALRNGDQLANACSLLEQKRAALEEARQAETEDRMVQEVSLFVRQICIRQDQPQVVKKSRELFTQFTNNGYELIVDSETGYMARDTLTSNFKTLDQLSSGTRVQLLLSVRLAFIQVTEGEAGVRLPLFLDEVLANSDDVRAEAIASTVGKIANDRQVFYFTAQLDEADKLMKFAGAGNCVSVDLVRTRTAYEAARRPLTAGRSIAIEPVPRPVDDYMEYGRLCKVPGADLWRAVSEHHAWHLMDNSAELYSHLQKGLAAIGQLPDTLQERRKLLERVQELARQGRGRELTLYAFESADIGGVNKKNDYYSTLCSLVQEANGDGRKVLAGIQSVARLRQPVKDAIKDWLLAGGYVSNDAVMDEKSILLTILKESPGLTMESPIYGLAARWLAACGLSGRTA